MSSLPATDNDMARRGLRMICTMKALSAVRTGVARRMRALGLKVIQAKKFKVTTDSNHSKPVAPDLIEQDFSAQAPNEKWVSDISYIWTDEGWLYLAVIMDLYSRAIVGWSMSRRMTQQLVCDALTMALFRRHFPKGTIIHSDRGSQYLFQAISAIDQEQWPALQHGPHSELL